MKDRIMDLICPKPYGDGCWGGVGGGGGCWGAVVMVMKREREIVYYYRWDPHEHILRGDDKAPGDKQGLHVAAT